MIIANWSIMFGHYILDYTKFTLLQWDNASFEEYAFNVKLKHVIKQFIFKTLNFKFCFTQIKNLTIKVTSK